MKKRGALEKAGMGLLKHTAASQGTGPSFPLLSHKPAQAQLTSSLPARPSPTMLSNHAPTRGSCQCLSQRGRTPGHWQMRTPKHIEIPVQSCQGAASVNSLRSQGESPESLRAGGFPCPRGPWHSFIQASSKSFSVSSLCQPL